jgi:MoxR-like ATPase
MPTRHKLDTSLRFDRQAVLPATREITVVDPVPPHEPKRLMIESEPYLASAELQDAVNLAIALGRPLLLQGDPGSGKTRLAHAVAFSLGLPLEEAYIKSTSRAQDLLYSYDAVSRLYDAQLHHSDSASGPDVRDAREYIRLGPLGRAIARASVGYRSVVLIDEIDKADIDFPNDLLHELDQLTFEVPEAPGMRFSVPTDRPNLRPLIFVTNNEEKTLPTAFLRRCIFHYVTFPDDPDYLAQILAMHEVGSEDLGAEAIRVLLRLRQLDLAKKPGLSELLDWVGYLHEVQTPVTKIKDLPYPGALLKQRGDQIRADQIRADQIRAIGGSVTLWPRVVRTTGQACRISSSSSAASSADGDFPSASRITLRCGKRWQQASAGRLTMN